MVVAGYGTTYSGGPTAKQILYKILAKYRASYWVYMLSVKIAA